MITPNELRDLEVKKYDLEKIEKAIDESIIQNHGSHEWEEAILDSEYPVAIRHAIAKRYIASGWKYVYHRTSSENNEFFGLTRFIFSQRPLKISNYYKVFRSDAI